MEAAVGFSSCDMRNMMIKASRLSAYTWFTQCHITKETVEQPLMNDGEKHKGCNLLHFMKPNTI
jgi:hypothetical protein